MRRCVFNAFVAINANLNGVVDTRGGTRTHNLLLRREAPYPLGHTSMGITPKSPSGNCFQLWIFVSVRNHGILKKWIANNARLDLAVSVFLGLWQQVCWHVCSRGPTNLQSKAWLGALLIWAGLETQWGYAKLRHGSRDTYVCRFHCRGSPKLMDQNPSESKNWIIYTKNNSYSCLIIFDKYSFLVLIQILLNKQNFSSYADICGIIFWTHCSRVNFRE